MPGKTRILNHRQVQQKIDRIARQLYENTFDHKTITLIGIAEKGDILAARLKAVLETISDQEIVIGSLKIKKNNKINPDPEFKDITPEDITGKTVILVDDVLKSGTVLMYGTCHVMSNDPRQLITVVLVDRRHRLYPVRADFVGMTLATTMQEHINVVFGKKEDAVYLS